MSWSGCYGIFHKVNNPPQQPGFWVQCQYGNMLDRESPAGMCNLGANGSNCTPLFELSKLWFQLSKEEEADYDPALPWFCPSHVKEILKAKWMICANPNCYCGRNAAEVQRGPWHPVTQLEFETHPKGALWFCCHKHVI